MLLWIGEILVDMIGKESNGIMSFERYPGGAPFNAAVGASNLGANVGFIGSVGNDLMGKFLYDFAKGLNLNYLDINLDNNHNTTIAFVQNDKNGERSFCFNRKSTADYYFNDESLEKIKDADIISLGSLMLSEKEGRETAEKVVKLVKENGKLLSFDCNYRSDIYESEEAAKEISLKCVKDANILKFSSEEVELLSGIGDIDEGISKITRPDQLVLVTLGSLGSRFYYKGIKRDVKSIKVKPVDTTGAGDAFYAGVLSGIDGKDFDSLKEEELVEILKTANICGAMACMKKGAMSALPTKEDLDNYLKTL